MLARSSCQTFRSALQTRTINANQAGEAGSSYPGCSQSRLSALPIPPGTFSYNCYKHLKGNSVFFGSAEYCSLFLLINYSAFSGSSGLLGDRWGKWGFVKQIGKNWRDALFSNSVAVLGCVGLNEKKLFNFSLSFSSSPS